MNQYKKEVYYFKKPRHIYAIFCSKEFIKFIDPYEIKFKITDDWFTANHWPLLIESIFHPNKIQHEITLE